jgi:hypothetical protein
MLVQAMGRRGGLRVKVSSRNVTPAPSVPPMARRLSGDQVRPFIISAKRANRTPVTLPFWASPSIARARKLRWSVLSADDESGSLPYARPKAISSLRA